MMATLFVYGPNAGDWEACAKEAEYKVPPPRDHELINQLIELEREADASRLLDIGEEAEVDWEKMADRAALRLQQIAQGEIVGAKAFEVNALKEIINRGHGKIGTKLDKDEERKVIILPALGFGEQTHIEQTVCPNCGEVLYDPDLVDA
jgi:hypothetical protein